MHSHTEFEFFVGEEGFKYALYGAYDWYEGTLVLYHYEPELRREERNPAEVARSLSSEFKTVVVVQPQGHSPIAIAMNGIVYWPEVQDA